MTNEEKFYLKEIYFKSADKDWHEKYLTQQDLRITALLRSKLDNNFWENYARVRLRFEKESLLLLRIKSITESAVCFSQIWKTEAIAESFRDEALRGIDMMALLKEAGVENTEVISHPSESDVLKLISEIRTRPHIIQVISPQWKTEDMTIGDPLKRGKLYLPYPT